MANWRPFADYTPLAQVLVQYMWEQRPPLLPAQFATKAGISRQTMARILNQDANPEPSALLRMARLLAVPAQQLFELAGYTTAQDPIFTREEAWDLVLETVASSPTITEQQRHACLTVLRSLHSPPTGKSDQEVNTMTLAPSLPALPADAISKHPEDENGQMQGGMPASAQ